MLKPVSRLSSTLSNGSQPLASMPMIHRGCGSAAGGVEAAPFGAAARTTWPAASTSSTTSPRSKHDASPPVRFAMAREKRNPNSHEISTRSSAAVNDSLRRASDSRAHIRQASMPLATDAAPRA
jgi:hypothetical protein